VQQIALLLDHLLSPVLVSARRYLTSLEQPFVFQQAPLLGFRLPMPLILDRHRPGLSVCMLVTPYMSL
jgi:hypothetical protein